MRKLLRVEWLLLLLIFCIWFPQICLFQKEWQHMHHDAHPDIAEPVSPSSLS